MTGRRVEWTVATLKEHLDARIEADHRAVSAAIAAATEASNAAMNAAKEAVLKAELASEKRFESVNEFRSTLADQQRTLMPRSEAELRLGTLEGRVAKLENESSTRGGAKSGGRELWAWIVGALGAAVLLWNVFINR